MARSNLDDEQAFQLLRRASQRLNVKLTQVAEQVVDGTSAGDLQGGDSPPSVTTTGAP